jgi:two-component system sensor histidine kinase KdpD
MAAAFGAEWMAVAVESKPGAALVAGTREKVAQHLRLAEQLGAETHTLIGENVAQTILEFARSRNVTKLVVGKTAQPWWKRTLFGTVIDQLLDNSGDIDVYVIRGESESAESRITPPPPAAVNWSHYIATAGVVTVCGLLGWLSDWFGLKEANIVMVFLLGVAFVAARFGRGPAIAASVASVLAFDFFFVPPRFAFTVNDAQYFLTFAVMLVIGLFISTLTARLKEQLRASQEQERRTAALYRFTKQLSQITGLDFLVGAAGQQLKQIFSGEVLLFLREPTGVVSLRFGADTDIAKHSVNAIVATWVTEHDQMAGAGTDTLPNATALFVPLVGSQRTVGALGVKSLDPQRFLDPDERRLLESCGSLIALSIERDLSVLEAHEAQVRVETEQLRSSLLSSVSHDLRTPLAAIAGASSSLLDDSQFHEPPERRELLQSIVDESKRLARLVDNLLDMTRLEAGHVKLNKEWHVLEEIVGSARSRLRRELEGHRVHVEIPGDLPLVNVDGLLLEQVLVNLLENAARYTPAGSHIQMAAKQANKRVEIHVSDNGPGLPRGAETRVFEKFFRGSSTPTPDGRRGAGLGLTICKAIVNAHGGQITARNGAKGGAEFIVSLPCEDVAPRVALDEAATNSSS